MGRRLAPGRLWQLLGLLLLATAAAGPLLFSAGFLNTRGGGDSPFLLFRLHQLLAALADGQFPARWMPDAAYGLGYPFFSYYASLPYYLAAALAALGFGLLAALKLTQWLGFLLAAWAVWGLVRHWRRSEPAAWLVAGVYTFAPYHLVNVYVRGDSLVEFWAMGLYPLIIWLALRLWQRPGRERFVQLALAYAVLVCTHNVSALIFSPFLLILVLLLGWRGRRWHLAASLLLGLALSAFFWLPALGEQGAVQLVAQTSGYFHYSNHFRTFGGGAAPLVQPSWLFNFDVAGRSPFSMGAVQALLVAAGLLATLLLLLRRRRALRRQPVELFAVLALLISTLMITPASRWLWERVPLLPLVQFPWRFLSVQALSGALLLAWLLTAGRPRTAWVLATLGVLLAASAMLGLRPDFVSLASADMTPENLQLYEWFSGNVGTTIRYEYLPRAVVPRLYTSDALVSGEAPAARVLQGGASVQLLEKRTGRESWQVQVQSGPAVVSLPTLYWPGWQARVDGQRVELYPAESLGTLTLSVPAGAHRVDLRLGRTPLRLAAELLSGLSLLAALLWWRPALRRYGRAGLLALGALLALALFLRLLPARELSADDLTWDFDQQAYLHHNPQGVRFGGAAVMESYQLHADAAGRLSATVRWSALAQDGLVAELALVHPAEPQQGVPYTLAAARQTLAETETSWTLVLPADAPPGPLLPRLRVWDAAGRPLPALTSSGQERGDLYLVPLRLVFPAPAGPPEGEPRLLDAAATFLDPQHLAVSLTWQVGAALPANLKLALRLRDAAGRQWAELDTQPGYGFYPTSSWQPGTRFGDRYVLEVPYGLPPGEYELSVLLYDAATLAPRWGPVMRSLPVATAAPYDGRPLVARFGEQVAVAGLQSPVSVAQGDPLEVQITWVTLSEWSGPLTLNWELLDAAGQTAATGAETRALDWPADSVLLARYTWALDPQLPAGDYRLQLSLADSAGSPLGSPWGAADLTLTPRDRLFELPPVQVEVGANFGDLIELAGYDLAQSADRVELTLVWRALTRPPADYRVFVHLFDPLTEQIPVQSDAMPRAGQYPTSRWVPGEVVVDTVTLSLSDVPPGDYRLGVGLYQVLDGQYPRLPAVDAAGRTLPDGRLVLPAELSVPAD